MKKILSLVLLFSFGMSTQTATAQCLSVGNGTNGGIYSMFPDSLNSCLYIGGDFQSSGGDTLNYCGFWNDTLINPMGMGMFGTNNSVRCFTNFNGSLYVGGDFTRAGDVVANYIARWDGTTWYPVGIGFNKTVQTLCVFNNELYAGGYFTTSGDTPINHFAKWNGTEWVQVDGGMNDNVLSMCVWNNNLYIGGDFTQAGNTATNHICYWDGNGFSGLGTGISNGGMMNNQGSVQSLCVYEGELYCGGTFNNAGGMWMKNIALWNGSNWSSIGNIGMGMMSGRVNAMCVYDGSLYVGGYFNSCNGNSANNIGVWNGALWSSVGTGINGSINSLSVYGDMLYMGGAFTNADGISVSNIASYSSITTSIQHVETNTISFKTHPNPASTFVQCQWIQQKPSVVTLEVFNITGRKVLHQSLGSYNSGLQTQNISVNDLNEGTYLFAITCGNERELRKVYIVK